MKAVSLRASPGPTVNELSLNPTVANWVDKGTGPSAAKIVP
jgi:hypothetical protein